MTYRAVTVACVVILLLFLPVPFHEAEPAECKCSVYHRPFTWRVIERERERERGSLCGL